jgi:hypothetical protein
MSETWMRTEVRPSFAHSAARNEGFKTEEVEYAKEQLKGHILDGGHTEGWKLSPNVIWTGPTRHYLGILRIWINTAEGSRRPTLSTPLRLPLWWKTAHSAKKKRLSKLKAALPFHSRNNNSGFELKSLLNSNGLFLSPLSSVANVCIAYLHSALFLNGHSQFEGPVLCFCAAAQGLSSIFPRHLFLRTIESLPCFLLSTIIYIVYLRAAIFLIGVSILSNSLLY